MQRNACHIQSPYRMIIDIIKSQNLYLNRFSMYVNGHAKLASRIRDGFAADCRIGELMLLALIMPDQTSPVQLAKRTLLVILDAT